MLPAQTLPAVSLSAQPAASTSTAAGTTQWIKTSNRHLSLMNPSTFAKRSSARLTGPTGGRLVGAKQLTKEELEGKKTRLGNMSLVLNGVQAARCGLQAGWRSAAAIVSLTEGKADQASSTVAGAQRGRRARRRAARLARRRSASRSLCRVATSPRRVRPSSSPFPSPSLPVIRTAPSYSSLITPLHRSSSFVLNHTPLPFDSGPRRAHHLVILVRPPIPGRCNKALSCPYVHDPAKLSICQSFLRGSCANSASACPLSHEPSAHNTPSCSHFAASGVCRAGEACLYPHVRTAEDAPLCADFGRYGWCEKGSACDERHAWECKEFAERGTCRMDGKCGLRHVLRSQAGRTASPPADGPAFFIDSTGDRPVGEDGDGAGRASGRRHGPKIDSGALIANQDDFIQLDFDTDSDGDEDEDEDDSESEGEGEAASGGEADDEDVDDEAEVADSVALLLDAAEDESPASDADDDDPRPRR